MRNVSRGQTSIEFLMSYGWMLIVVGVAGGAFYSVAQPSCQKTISPPLDRFASITDFGMDTEGNMDIMFRNTYSDPVQINSVTVTQNNISREVQPQLFLAVSEKDSIELPGIRSTSGCHTFEISITYDAGSLQDLEKQGTLTAPLAMNASYVSGTQTGNTGNNGGNSNNTGPGNSGNNTGNGNPPESPGNSNNTGGPPSNPGNSNVTNN